MLATNVLEMTHGAKALNSVQGSTSAFFNAEIDAIFSMNETEFTKHFSQT